MKKTSFGLLLSILLAHFFVNAVQVPRPKTALNVCDAVSLAEKKYWSEAQNCAVKQNDLATRKLIEWMCFQDGKCEFDFNEITAFIEKNPHFPDQERLVKRAEDKITEELDHSVVMTWFNKHKPTTGNGIKYYYDIKLPTIEKKETLIGAAKYGWIYGNHDRQERRVYLQKYGRYLSEKDHIEKVNTLIIRGNNKIDDDVLELLPDGYKKVIKARLALRDGAASFTRAIASVPKHLRNDPGLLLSEAMWYKNKDDYKGLMSLIAAHHNNSSILKDDWFKIRTRLIGELLDEQQYQIAYDLAKHHHYKDSINYVDGEWLAGRIAYFYLKQPKLALVHFEKMEEKAKYSVSKAKASYWAANAAQKIGEKEKSNKYFTLAASYPDNFYGQLAATHLNKAGSINLKSLPKPTPEDIKWFDNNILIRISKILIAKKKYALAEKFMKAAIATANNPAKIALIVRMGYDINIPRIAVNSGKEAVRHGCFLPHHVYPTLGYSPGKDQIEKGLMLAIIRQESAFDPQAVSTAEAMGLMQLIHPTAKEVGRKLGIKFRKQDLLHNQKLNLTFGCHHLTESIEYYDGSYVLAIAAYNAGPGNVNKWIQRFGDPRELKTPEQVVTWIEKIPFYETRGYVQNVLANLQIYRSLLKNPKTNVIDVRINEDLLR